MDVQRIGILIVFYSHVLHPSGALDLVSEIREIGCLVLLIYPESEVDSRPLGGPVLEGFGYVGDSDGVGSAQVGYGAGHFEDAVVGPCR